MAYQVTYACISHVGKRRKSNQDNFYCDGICARPDAPHALTFPLTGKTYADGRPLFAVFDGMGGEERGEMASLLAAQTARTAQKSGDAQSVLSGICRKANDAVCRFTDQNNLEACGTTAAMLLFDAADVTVCNVGDSKIYHLANGQLEQISVDHLSLAPRGHKAPLAQYIGMPPTEMMLCPSYSRYPLQDGDKYLICSDGLTDMVPTASICSVLSTFPPTAAAQQLVQSALDNGGKDNVTVLVLELAHTSKSSLPASARRSDKRQKGADSGILSASKCAPKKKSHAAAIAVAAAGIAVCVIGGTIYAQLSADPHASTYRQAVSAMQGGDYSTAAGLFGGLGSYKDSTERKLEAMGQYVQAVDADDFDRETAYTYLQTLLENDADTWQPVYDALFSWKAVDVYWSTDEEGENKVQTAKAGDKVYFHFTVSGGEPGASVQLYEKSTWSDGYKTDASAFEKPHTDGNSSWVSWQLPNNFSGSLTEIICDANGSELASGTLSITKHTAQAEQRTRPMPGSASK